jgi:hypothetical protein
MKFWLSACCIRAPRRRAHGSIDPAELGKAESTTECGFEATQSFGRQPRYPKFQAFYALTEGPEALRPRLSTGLPMCDGSQLSVIGRSIQLSSNAYKETRFLS